MRVEADGLGVLYGERRALDIDHLELDVGVTALVGPNGAGKTTLMKCVATVLSPSRGRLGWSPWSRVRDVRERLGYLPQTFRFSPRFSVIDTVRYVAWCRGLSSELAWRAADDAVSELGLADVAHRRIRALSGGTRQRLGLATALAGPTDLLVLDEPSVGLDPGQRDTFRRLIRQRGEKATVLVSTHMIDDVVAVADRVVFLDRGRVVEDAPVPTVVARFGAPGGSDYDALTLAYRRLVGGPDEW